jgi:excisionase family DNA binding protein
LCANCHARADSEHWGEKTLREYKKRPWILRQGSEAQKVTSAVLVQITIDLNLEQFDERHQRLFLYALAAFLDIPPSAIKISDIKPSNSLEINVRLGVDKASKLLSAYREGDAVLLAYFAPFNVIRVELKTQRDTPKTRDRRAGLPRRFRSDFVGIDEAARFLKVAPVTVRRWIHRGLLPAMQAGVDRRWLIKLDQLEALSTSHGLDRKRSTPKKRPSQKRIPKKTKRKGQ